MRGLLIGLMLLASATAVEARTITLSERMGGYVKQHLDTADRWIRTGAYIVLTGDQWSAAALQVAYFAGQKPYRICARRGVMLHYHGSCNDRARICRRGAWLSRKPSFVGIPTCR